MAPMIRRRVMSASSGLGPESAAAVAGSNAMPQMGQLPGPVCLISGCIGQVNSMPCGMAACAAAIFPGSR